MSEDKKSGGMMTKVIASVFAAIVAPVAVTLGIKYLAPKDDKPPTLPDNKPPSYTFVFPDSGKSAPPGKEGPKPPEPVALFNGKNLEGFYTYLKEGGRNTDPKKVFSVVPDPKNKDQNLLRISGEEPGYLATSSRYKFYKLIVEYKWGEKTWAPREDKSRRSGITVHNQSTSAGTDGFLDNYFSPYGYHILLGEGGQTGDLFFPKGGPTELKLTAELPPLKTGPKATQPLQVFTKGQPPREVVAPGVIYQINHVAQFKDEKGFTSTKDLENKPLGEWNTLEIVCNHAPVIGVWLNKESVNFGRSPTMTGGRILFHSRGAEIFFRKIEMTPIPPPPPPKKT